MKNSSLCLMILSLLIISCTTDAIDTASSNNSTLSKNETDKSGRLVQNLTPENPANNYDLAGKFHNDVLDAFLAANYQYRTMAQISQQIEAIIAVNNDLALLNSRTNLPVNLEEIRAIVNNPEAKLEETIANSLMTNSAKASLRGFMNDLFLWENEQYEVIYQSVISYESSVMTNSQFSSQDKRIILTTSSIVRYSLYYAKERKDKDWETSVGNRVGGVIGATDQSIMAVKKALIAGIIQNNHVTD